MESQLTDGFVKRFISTTKCQTELVEMASSLFCNFIFNRFKRQQQQKRKKTKRKKQKRKTTLFNEKVSNALFDIPPQTNPHRSFLHFPPHIFLTPGWFYYIQFSFQFSVFPHFSWLFSFVVMFSLRWQEKFGSFTGAGVIVVHFFPRLV